MTRRVRGSFVIRVSLSMLIYLLGQLQDAEYLSLIFVSQDLYCWTTFCVAFNTPWSIHACAHTTGYNTSSIDHSSLGQSSCGLDFSCQTRYHIHSLRKGCYGTDKRKV